MVNFNNMNLFALNFMAYKCFAKNIYVCSVKILRNFFFQLQLNVCPLTLMVKPQPPP